MARFSCTASEEYALKLSRMEGHTEEIARRALHEGAGIVADAIRANLNAVTSANATGDLAASLGITPMRMDGGVWNVKIGFDGYDRKGVPNQLKARVLESGSSRQKKRPFVRPAVSATREAAVAAIERTIDEEIEKIMKG